MVSCAARGLVVNNYEAVAWQEAAQHNIQISFNTLMLNEPGEAALALAANLAQFAAAVAALENCSVRCSACGNALRSSQLHHAILSAACSAVISWHAVYNQCACASLFASLAMKDVELQLSVTCSPSMTLLSTCNLQIRGPYGSCSRHASCR